MTLITRRGLIAGGLALIAAPAIVRAGSLMPVKVVDFGPQILQVEFIDSIAEDATEGDVVGHLITDLEPGNYYARARIIHPVKGPGEWSKARTTKDGEFTLCWGDVVNLEANTTYRVQTLFGLEPH